MPRIDFDMEKWTEAGDGLVTRIFIVNKRDGLVAVQGDFVDRDQSFPRVGDVISFSSYWYWKDGDEWFFTARKQVEWLLEHYPELNIMFLGHSHDRVYGKVVA